LALGATLADVPGVVGLADVACVMPRHLADSPIARPGDNALLGGTTMADFDMTRAEHLAWLQQARSHLRAADPMLARLIDDRPDFDPHAWMARLVPPLDLYGALMWQIIGQQLSVASAGRIIARLEAMFDGVLPSPAQLLGTEQAKLREAGLSWRKIATLRDLAERLLDGRLDQEELRKLPDDELVRRLTAMPGIGPWTVQGALIIAFRREDVVLRGDLALRKAVKAVYQLDHLPSEQEVADIAEPWRPYRTLATFYLYSAPAGEVGRTAPAQ
jgi:DNA-3-methyladenine glycosylase II